MMQFTEEHRAELIKYCKRTIREAKSILPSLEGIDPDSGVARQLRRQLEVHELALTALSSAREEEKPQ
ncbi:hypothetical protein [Pantoea septica]|uniref:hypothetical protein n=1 Tax=Pantoea septica TaxID=472695 RepID=UPI003D074C80